jgi:hypothetical protein
MGDFLLTSRNQFTAGDIIRTANGLLSAQIAARGRFYEPNNAIERMYLKYGDFFVSYSNQFLKFDRRKLELLLKDEELTSSLDQVDLDGCGKSALSSADHPSMTLTSGFTQTSPTLQAM